MLLKKINDSTLKRICIIRHRDYYELPVRREAESLNNAGYEVDVICMQQKGHERFEKNNGIHIYRLPLKRKKGNVFRYLFDYVSFFILSTIKVTQLHLMHPYKAIQVNTMPDFLVFVTIIPRLLGAKVIAFMKEPTPELGITKYKSSILSYMLKFVEQIVLKYADLSFTVTQQLKDVYVSRGANADKIQVVLNGPDPYHFKDYDHNFNPDPSLFTLVCHGAVEERYGHDTILKAVNLARSYVTNLRLKLLGTGSYGETVKNMIKHLQLDDCVEYFGWVSMQKLVEELCRANVGIVAQKSSPYSNLVHTNKMYEYIIFGKPAIITRLKSVSKYFDHSSMYYFEANNPKSLADAIINLHKDSEKCKALVKNAKKLFMMYSWENQSKIFLRAYEELLRD
jgi:glycosyltransferase involved in cell wall biosynthesis